jgi:anti-sigma factor RsiW
MKRQICHDNDTLVDAYYDGELSPAEALDFKSHLNECRECVQRLRDYSSISGSLEELSRQELQRGEGISLWPDIHALLEDKTPPIRRQPVKRRLFLLRRPAWIGLGLSAAAALILFFSGAFQSEKFPSNYCRIENISSPDHNYMIYQDKNDGMTIIWIME